MSVRVQIQYEDDPLEITVSVEHPLREEALGVAAQMAAGIARATRPVPLEQECTDGT
jgi:hypothetical protein